MLIKYNLPSLFPEKKVIRGAMVGNIYVVLRVGWTGIVPKLVVSATQVKMVNVLIKTGKNSVYQGKKAKKSVRIGKIFVA